MPPIHRTSYREAQVPPPRCLAGHLARLIDEQARTGLAVTDGGQGQAEPATGNALIWVEGDQGLAAARGSGLLVVAHGAGQAVTERSCIIFYSSGATDRGHGILDVSERLAAMGWLLLSCLCRETAAGHANIAVLVNHELPGQEWRLWLAAWTAPQAKGRAVSKPVLPGGAKHRLSPPPARPASLDPGPALPLQEPAARSRRG